MGLFGRRGGDADASTSARDAPTTAEEHARHEAAAQAVLRSMVSDPPPNVPAYDDPRRLSQGAAPGQVSPAAMRAMQMPDLPPSADLPARGGNFGAVRGEDAFESMMQTHTSTKGKLVVVKFGASWCTHCAGMLPAFGDASRLFPDAHFVLADVDTLPDTAAHVRFTPTFAFFRDGRKVDEVSKIKPRDFEDRMWLHAGEDRASS
jgi:thioredoxin 1